MALSEAGGVVSLTGGKLALADAGCAVALSEDRGAVSLVGGSVSLV